MKDLYLLRMQRVMFENFGRSEKGGFSKGLFIAYEVALASFL